MGEMTDVDWEVLKDAWLNDKVHGSQPDHKIYTDCDMKKKGT